ncbi:MAG: Xaa-Pro peptidase family protein [Treponema sp.]|jgi:Xaa-Pro dipeptidase|nr:Xaa-Pro peptidase family protein [Treponema sp.]
MNQYQMRLEKLFDWMAQESITLAVFEDTEGRRDRTIRHLTGQPGDALLLLSLDRKTVLVPWDINMAKVYAHADMIIPYSEFERLPCKAIAVVAEMLGIPAGSKIEIPPVTPYPLFLNYVGKLTDFDILCRERGLSAEARKIRAVKDDEEIKIYRKAAAVTNALIGLLEKNVRSGKIKTEADAALLIEVEARRHGCEGTGFETLAAGPGRSFGIHAHPAWTDSPFAGPGLSILDFGVRLAGYTTDVTLTFVREASPRQEKIAGLVEKAAKLAFSMAGNGTAARSIALAVEELFARAKKRMPHALGHGIGLEEHEYPAINSRSDNEWKIEPGMVFTLEPGLYDPLHGGCRLENDILMTETGPELLTEARTIRL